MKITKKLSVLVLSAVLACSATSCTLGTGKWSYKTDIATISAGSWICNTYQCYNDAVSKIQEAHKDDEDFDVQLMDITKETVEDKNAVDWIFDEAKDKCISLLTMEKLIQDKGVVIDPEQLQMTADMYVQYYYSGSEEATAFYEKLGVSKESFADSVTKYNYLYQELFSKLYGKDGEKEVADKDVQQYYTDNYISYYYIAYPLKTTDEDGNAVDIDAETQETVTANFNKYRNMLNNEKKTTDDVDAQYQADFEVDSVPKSANTSLKTDFDETTLDDELKKAIKNNKANEADVKTIGDNLYLIYTKSVSDLAKTIKYAEDAGEDETDYIDKSDVVYTMKKDEFDQYIEDEKKSLKYETNNACISKYTVERTVQISKEN